MRKAERTNKYLVPAVIIAIALAGTVTPSTPIPALAIFAPIAYFGAVLGGVGSASILLVLWPYSKAPRATFVLALTLAASAIFMVLAILVSPLPAAAPIIAAPLQSAFYLYFLWHLTTAVGAFAYVSLRRRDDSKPPSRRFVTGVATTVAILVMSAVLLTLAFGDRLPILGGRSALAAPWMAALLVLATILAFRIREPNRFDRAFSWSLLAFALSTVLLPAAARFSTTFYTGRLLLLGVLFVFVAALQILAVARRRLSTIEGSFSQVEGESATRAGRIRAVWEIASHVAQPGEDRFRTILEIATKAMRPGTPMFGTLSHLDGQTVVFDATSWMASAAPPPSLANLARPGATFPLERMMQSQLCAAGHTVAWDDLTPLLGRGMLFEELGWKSFIGAPVTIARQTYFVTFGSLEPMTEGYAEDDIAYVDVVASFFTSRFTEQQQFERIQFQIEHDALTGLENRVQFRKAVRDEISSGKAFTLAFVDLDGFRHINEQQGHQIGDEVLVEVASGLGSVTKDDLVARMSADEFGIVLRGTGSFDAAGVALSRYAELFREPFHTGDRNGTQLLGIGASIGAARFPADGNSAEDLMRRADVALDVAKGRGGSTTMIFDKQMEAILEEAHFRVVELAAAIASGQLALVYQPTFDLATRAIVGAEALVRWDHPTRGRIMPAEFIDFAERNGMIASLTRWVFRRVIEDLTHAPLPAGLRVYFNVSAQMLDNIPFIAEVQQTLRAAPNLVQHLGIEVTETAAMQNVERSMNTIDLFRSWGLSVAIDDFGTGHSSLAYLKQLTVDVIKIDRSFVMGLPDDERDGALTEMLLRITTRFGFATLAEGIETEAQASWLLEHGCRLGQGYLIAKPHSFDELLERLDVPSAA